MTEPEWTWDPSLYEGSATHYVRGRVAYPPALVEALVAELRLDGRGRLLDVGCGPGSLTLPLAPSYERATGLDADAGMLAEAARQAAAAGVTNVDWLHARAEDLPPGSGPFRTVVLAQSFHWMDRDRVARLLHDELAPDGALVHVHATTHEGVDGDEPLDHPRPPRPAIGDLVERSLGSRHRAGQSVRRPPDLRTETSPVEAAAYQGAGFTGPARLEVAGTVVTRTTDDVVASVLSLSSAAPHLFGARLGGFEAELRELLLRASPSGRFSERMRDMVADVWRP